MHNRANSFDPNAANVYHHVVGRRHTPVVCNEIRAPYASHYSSRPETTKNYQTIHTSHYPSRNKFSKSCNDVQVKKPINIKFQRRHLCRSQFLEHRPHCQSEEQLRSVASKSFQLVNRRATESILQRRVMKIPLVSPQEPCASIAPG